MAGAGAASMLMMVAIIGIIAAIAIPSLLRARTSANESAAIGDVRTIISAEAAFEARAGNYGTPECLAAPTRPGCLVGYAAGEPTFLDPVLAGSNQKSGYRLSFVGGAAKPTRASPQGFASYCYSAVPVQAGTTGVRSFAGDQTGRICFDRSGEDLCAGGILPEDCTPLQ
jgi:type II secretory pathway pseudopilin PulG